MANNCPRFYFLQYTKMSEYIPQNADQNERGLINIAIGRSLHMTLQHEQRRSGFNTLREMCDYILFNRAAIAAYHTEKKLTDWLINEMAKNYANPQQSYVFLKQQADQVRQQIAATTTPPTK